MAHMFEPCNYQKCLTCHLLNCFTGQIAREQGEEMYDLFIQELDECIEDGCNCMQAWHPGTCENAHI